MDLSPEEISKGVVSSMIHIDWMIGSNEIDVDGIDQKGNVVPVFRKVNGQIKINKKTNLFLLNFLYSSISAFHHEPCLEDNIHFRL